MRKTYQECYLAGNNRPVRVSVLLGSVDSILDDPILGGIENINYLNEK